MIVPIQKVVIPQNSCLQFYECKTCHKMISPTPGSCCVICAYSDKTCPVFVRGKWENGVSSIFDSLK